MGKLRKLPTVDQRIDKLKAQKKVTGGKAPALPPGVTVEGIKPKRKKAKRKKLSMEQKKRKDALLSAL
jgi:hypothetical protein